LRKTHATIHVHAPLQSCLHQGSSTAGFAIRTIAAEAKRPTCTAGEIFCSVAWTQRPDAPSTWVGCCSGSTANQKIPILIAVPAHPISLTGRFTQKIAHPYHPRSVGRDGSGVGFGGKWAQKRDKSGCSPHGNCGSSYQNRINQLSCPGQAATSRYSTMLSGKGTDNPSSKKRRHLRYSSRICAACACACKPSP
jgi:hypothetical protein